MTIDEIAACITVATAIASADYFGSNYTQDNQDEIKPMFKFAIACGFNTKEKIYDLFGNHVNKMTVGTAIDIIKNSSLNVKKAAQALSLAAVRGDGHFTGLEKEYSIAYFNDCGIEGVIVTEEDIMKYL